MDSTRLPFKADAFGNSIYARVTWSKEVFDEPRPIALIYHAGGLVMGSCEMIPPAQVGYLASRGFLVVMPNYRLLPQVTAKEALADGEEAFDWARNTLPGIMKAQHHVESDINRIVVLGHSSGGTISMHLASLLKPIKAITALYPLLYAADTTTNGHQPYSDPPFGNAPDYELTDEEWATVVPSGLQLSESRPPTDLSDPSPRVKWMSNLFKNGRWMAAAQPDGDLKAIDPMTRLSAEWPPIMIIHGSEDRVPGRSVGLVQRAEMEMKAAGIEACLEVVQGEPHLFDHSPDLGTTDMGHKWQAVTRGLDWLVKHS